MLPAVTAARRSESELEEPRPRNIGLVPVAECAAGCAHGPRNLERNFKVQWSTARPVTVPTGIAVFTVTVTATEENRKSVNCRSRPLG